MKTFYRRNLPHIQPPGATLFVTFRLAGSLPRRVVIELIDEYEKLKRLIHDKRNKNNKEFKKYYNQQKRLMEKFDDCLHSSNTGQHFLRNESIAELVCSSMKHLDQKKYDLLAYCVMSNHVHIVFTPLKIADEEYVEIANIMHSIKSYTATEANKILARAGKKFWASESFDHYCRDATETARIIEYVLKNPVKSGLISAYDQWLWSYARDEVDSRKKPARG